MITRAWLIVNILYIKKGDSWFFDGKMFLFSPLLHISMQYLQQREFSYCQLCFIRVQKDFGPPQLCMVLLKYLQIRDVLWNLFCEHRRHTHAHPYLLEALTHSQPLTVCPHHVIFLFDLQLAAVVEWQRCGHRPPAGHISELKRHLLLQMLLVVRSTFSCGLLVQQFGPVLFSS